MKVLGRLLETIFGVHALICLAAVLDGARHHVVTALISAIAWILMRNERRKKKQ